MVKAPAMRISNEELLEKLRILAGPFQELKLTKETTALVCIDIQYACAHPDYGLGTRAQKLGLGDFLDYYWNQLQSTVIPNVQRLQSTARRIGIEIIHLRIASDTLDGRESSRRYKSMDMRAPSNTKEAEILPEVGPQGDELVISKSTSSPFNSTNIDRLLRNLGIRTLIFVGVVTNGCIESSARSAAELDYGTIVVEDATAAQAPQLHEASVMSMNYKDADIKSTEEVIALLEAL